MKTRTFLAMFTSAAAFGLATAPAPAQTVKIGVINTMSGPQSNIGVNNDMGMRLYMKLNQDKLPPGVKVELVVRDDAGANPDKAKQLAQELIMREKVQMLTGFGITANAMAVAPLTAEAKVPTAIMNAAASVVTTMSPYIARFSFTLWQSSYPLGKWAATKYKRAFIAVSDYVPGHDCEEAFAKGFTEAGGEIVGRVRMPLITLDYTPFMQRAKDSKPDVVFGFIPAGRFATQIIKSYGDLGMDKAGIKFIGPGDITTDEELPSMGDVPIGVMTVHHYSAASDRPANKAFVAAWKKEYGDRIGPSFMGVGGWDAMDAIYYAIREQKGKIDPDRTMELWKHYKNPNSPRGPISIDPETRDIVQNEYLREVRKVGGHTANVELEIIGTAVKDPWKEFNRKK